MEVAVVYQLDLELAGGYVVVALAAEAMASLFPLIRYCEKMLVADMDPSRDIPGTVEVEVVFANAAVPIRCCVVAATDSL